MATGGRADQSNALTGRISRRDVLGRLALASATIAWLAVMGASLAQAQSTPVPSGAAGVEPNHFVLDGDETQITLDTTTDAGVPQLTYEGPYGSQTFSGDTLSIEDGAMGRMATVYLGAFPDQGELWLTLLVPRFVPTTLDAEPAAFETLAILKWNVSTIAGPPREGALEEFRVLELEGTAELVES